MRKDFLFLLAAMLTLFFIGVLVGSLLFGETIIIEKEKPEEKQAVLNPLQRGKLKAEVNIVAISSRGEGVLSKGIVEIIDGEGRMLLSTNPFVEPDTQLSIDIAKNFAEQFTGKSLQEKDVIYSIEEIQADLVGGASAGAALTIATIAAIQEKQVKGNVAVTGTILPDGSIGQVGNVLEKAHASGEKGMKTFLVPTGQETAVFYEKTVEEKKGPGFIFKKVYYTPKQVNLNEAMQEQYGMKVIEVGSIEDALQYAIE